MAGQNGHLLSVNGLHVEREGSAILRGVDLELAPNSIHVLLGANGSGKSTLAYALMGSSGYQPERGEIWFGGENITRLSMYQRARRGLTLAWQEPARFEGLSVSRYLGLGMAHADPDRVDLALQLVGLPPAAYAERYVDEALSGGERKRVELAAIYCMAPRLAIMDETDSGIDALSLRDFSRVLRRLAKEGTAILLISHSDAVVALADRASLVVDGRVVATGSPKRMCAQYRRLCQAGQGQPLGDES